MPSTSCAQNIEHVMATDGRLVPIGCLECKREFNDHKLVYEEYFYRGNVYAIFYTYNDGDLVSNTNVDGYFKPEDPDNPSMKGAYGSNEFYPYFSLKLMATSVRYECWLAGEWDIGKNYFAPLD